MNRLIILDRDGVINVDSKEFIKTPNEWVAIPGSLEAIAKLNHAGFIVGIATNQSGVARGLFTIDTLNQIHEKMCAQLKKVGGKIDEIIFCPHGPTSNCLCRKPKPGMMLDLLNHWQANPADTWVIGDSFRDLEAGWAAGCKSILVKTGKGEQTLIEHPELEKKYCFDNLALAVDYILNCA